ncbi:MAG: hypothetical protein ACOY9Y_13510 [Bacillota bacterium]
MARAELEMQINLLENGDQFFDLLKAVVREWQGSPWPHERARADFARQLFIKGLDIHKEGLEKAKARTEKGFNTFLDQRMVRELEQKVSYWEKKLNEITPNQS